MTRSPLLLAAGCALDVSAVALVDAAAAAGFDGVSLRTSHQHALDRAGVRRLARALHDGGLALHDVEVHRIADGAPDPAPLIDVAAALGARSVLVVSDLADEALTIDALAAVATRCAASGLTAALEYMAWTTPASSVDAVRIARAAGAQIVVDVLHHHRLGEGAAELAAVVHSGRLGWVQVCDAPLLSPAGGVDGLVDEARHHRLAPGDGELPLSSLLGAVPVGTAVSVEVQSDELVHLPVAERAALLHRAARAVLDDGHDPSSTG